MSASTMIRAAVSLLRLIQSVDWAGLKDLVERDEEPTEEEIDEFARNARSDVDDI